MHDYSHYYCFCFSDYYSKFVKRVHFFNETLTEKDFEEFLLKTSIETSKIEEFSKTYLGFIVVKRLPKNIFGTTILRVYNSTEDKLRTFPALRNYKINLFGQDLKINSLAFQEQDKVLSACATSALWSAFQKTSKIFQTPLPTPSELTIMAGNTYHHSGRSLPSQGLEVEQICTTIEHIGLVSELRNKPRIQKNISWLKAFLYAYNNMGLPVLLGIKLAEEEKEKNGHHLITINGYRRICYSDKELMLDIKKSNEDFKLYAHHLERFYAHDDQIGPFSRIGFNKKGSDKIITSWWFKDDKKKLREANVECVIIPLYHKVRLTFEDIYINTLNLDKFIKNMRIFNSDELIWDIFLNTSNFYKKSFYKFDPKSFPEIFYRPEWLIKIRENVICDSLPRFLWISRALAQGFHAFDVIYDATEVADGSICIKVIFYLEKVEAGFHDLLKKPPIKDSFIQNLGKTLFNQFATEESNF